MSNNSLEAKICVLGAQGVGKTSLVQRYVKGTFSPPTTTSTVGASFLTKRALDVDSGTVVRLQIWDTAGQERFRSITKLYYRGASAVILVYSIVEEPSFVEMAAWLQEVRTNLGDDVIIHVVGTKSDMVAQDPGLRQVPFERCIAYVASNLHPTLASTPPPTAGLVAPSSLLTLSPLESKRNSGLWSDGKRNSGFWGQDIGWDVCHEISASSGEGIEEVFRVVTRKLVEQHAKRLQLDMMSIDGVTPGTIDGGVGPGPAGAQGYFDRPNYASAAGSFRLAASGDRRRSWLGFPAQGVGIAAEAEDGAGAEAGATKRRRRGCC